MANLNKVEIRFPESSDDLIELWHNDELVLSGTRSLVYPYAFGHMKGLYHVAVENLDRMEKLYAARG